MAGKTFKFHIYIYDYSFLVSFDTGQNYTKILEVNLFAFAYRPFHTDFSPINRTFCQSYIHFSSLQFYSVQLFLQYNNQLFLQCMSARIIQHNIAKLKQLQKRRYMNILSLQVSYGPSVGIGRAGERCSLFSCCMQLPPVTFYVKKVKNCHLVYIMQL